MNIRYCDRCKLDIIKCATLNVVEDGSIGKDTIDLCLKCYPVFREWLSMGNNTDDIAGQNIYLQGRLCDLEVENARNAWMRDKLEKRIKELEGQNEPRT